MRRKRETEEGQMGKGRKRQPVTSFRFFLAVFLLSSTMMAAQPGKWTLGLNIGPIFSNHWSTEDTPSGYEKPIGESGLSLGLYTNYRLSKRFSLQVGIGLAEKGAKHTLVIEGFPYGPVDVTYNTEHIEIPVWLKFYVIKKEKIRLYTGAGGYLAFLTKGRYLFENEFIPSFTEDMKDLKKSDMGMLFNWGLEVKVAHFLVHLEYRFTLGLTDISFPTGPGAPGVNLRNLAYVALLGVSFNSH